MATTTGSPSAPRSKSGGLARREALTGYLFIAPYLITAIMFTFGLLIYAFYNSFTNLTASYATKPVEFVGINNYVRALSDPNFRISLGNVFWFFVIVTTIQTIGAILLAVLLNAKLRGLQLYRTLLYSPSVASSIVISLIFLWLYLRTGFINAALSAITGNPVDIAWLERSDRIFLPIYRLFGIEQTSVPSLLRGPSIAWTAIMFMNIFTTIPTFMVMFLTALQDIPGHLYEAAAIDGATGRRAFFSITLPLLRPVITLVVILGTIGTFQVFDQVAILTAGGPRNTTLTPAYLIYQRTLGTGVPAEAGYASAMAFILAAIIVTITIIQRRYFEEGT